jgi:hypothetical protein
MQDFDEKPFRKIAIGRLRRRQMNIGDVGCEDGRLLEQPQNNVHSLSYFTRALI